MKIYVAHSSNSSFMEDVYNPIIDSFLNEKYSFVFPHINTLEQFNSKQFLKNVCDIFIAEVSNPSTGLGIEMGWANLFEVPIICIYKKDSYISNSLKVVCDNFLEYSNYKEMIDGIEELITKI